MKLKMMIGVVLALMLPGAAMAYDDPKSLVEAIYAPYSSGGGAPVDLQPFYSAHLKELFAVHAQRATLETASTDATPAAPAAFNPFIDADSALLFDLKVGEPAMLGDAALVSVSFHNFDHPSLLSLSLVKEADGWKVDDVASTGAGKNWLLSWLLLYDPWAMH
jgi:hypothetical protein